MNTLQAVISDYRVSEDGKIDQDGLGVLTRLYESDLAAETIAAITDDPNVARRIIGVCLECESLCRTFYKDVKVEREMPERLDRLSKEVADLKKFVKEISDGPKHRLETGIRLDPGEFDDIKTALGHIQHLIDARRRVAAETPRRFGATNKLDDGDETAALGWFAEGVEKITGRPHYKHVARLGEVVLRSKDITDDRVKEALRTRRQRDWRRVRA
jgi:hypothetical protein